MSGARGVSIVLAAAAVAGPAVAIAQSGGAGDNQYQDPFASSKAPSSKHKSSSKSSDKTTTTSTSTAPTTGSSSGSNQLSQSTNLGGNNSSTSPTSSGNSTNPSSKGNQLPNTGTDPRLVILAGLTLLLSGIGLRLRTADENF